MLPNGFGAPRTVDALSSHACESGVRGRGRSSILRFVAGSAASALSAAGRVLGLGALKANTLELSGVFGRGRSSTLELAAEPPALKLETLVESGVRGRLPATVPPRASPKRNTAPVSGVFGRGRSSTLVLAGSGAVKGVASSPSEGTDTAGDAERKGSLGSGVRGRGRSSIEAEVEVDAEGEMGCEEGCEKPLMCPAWREAKDETLESSLRASEARGRGRSRMDVLPDRADGDGEGLRALVGVVEPDATDAYGEGGCSEFERLEGTESGGYAGTVARSSGRVGGKGPLGVAAVGVVEPPGEAASIVETVETAELRLGPVAVEAIDGVRGACGLELVLIATRCRTPNWFGR